jgi:hypothetical protein
LAFSFSGDICAVRAISFPVAGTPIERIDDNPEDSIANFPSLG